MRIVHISDWHGKTLRLPSGDVYVVTGDMLPNFPKMKVVQGGGPQIIPPLGLRLEREIVKADEVNLQTNWCLNNPFRKAVGIDEYAPVIAVRGNHDFIDLHSWIGGNVWEVDEDCSRSIKFGVRFGGLRGINKIVGEWSDEIAEEDFEFRTSCLPKDIEVLVTHCPPAGILDKGWGDSSYGSGAIARWINTRHYTGGALKAHCFGHSHTPGLTKHSVIFSNAATTVNVFDI